MKDISKTAAINNVSKIVEIIVCNLNNNIKDSFEILFFLNWRWNIFDAVPIDR